MADITQLAELANNTLQTLAEQLADNRKALSSLQTYGRIYTIFQDDEILLNQKKLVSSNFWYSDTFDLINIQTASMQTDVLKKFYLETEVSSSNYSINSFFVTESSNTKKQFSLFYGNRLGSGSSEIDYYYPSMVTYKQYANKCLRPEDDTFTFGDGVNSDHIYGITFSNEYLSDGLNANYFQLALRELTGDLYQNSEYTGSVVGYKTGSYDVVTIIPDISPDTTILTENGNIYNLISGSIKNGNYTGSNGEYHYYGILYSDLGLVILNANKLDSSLNFNTVTGSNVNGFNAFKLFKSIEGTTVLNNGASQISNINDPPIHSFIVKKNKTIHNNYYFVYTRSFDYNYSTNPSFITGDSGFLKYKSFISNPIVYITSIGLYNDANDLLAVAKISKPLKKHFGKEYLIKIKLEF